MIWDFYTGDGCCLVISSSRHSWIPGFAVAFCIIALCIPGYHIYGFNRLWLTALRKTASVLQTHDIVSCHSLFSQPLSIYVALGIMNLLEWLKAHRMMRTGSVQSARCCTWRTHASYDCCVQGVLGEPGGHQGTSMPQYWLFCLNCSEILDVWVTFWITLTNHCLLMF